MFESAWNSLDKGWLRLFGQIFGVDKWLNCGLTDSPVRRVQLVSADHSAWATRVLIRPLASVRQRRSTPHRACTGQAPGEGGECCTSHQQHTHSTESREVLYPWHPWFGRFVWVHETRLCQGQLVARCGSD